MIRMFILMIAAIAGLTAAFLTYSTSDDGRAEAVTMEVPPEIKMQDVLVASELIEQGQMIGVQNVHWQKWPDAAVHAGFVTRNDRPAAVEELAGTMMRGRLLPGEPLRLDRLTPSNTSFMAALLPAGKRAVAVKVTAESSAGGFILPNDRVDVLLTRHDPGQGGAVTRAILRSVKILAIDQLVDGAASDAMIGRTATLELDAAQTEVITAAEASGMLSLALRSITDPVDSDPDPVGKTPDIASNQPAPEPVRKTVRIRRAVTMETVTLP